MGRFYIIFRILPFLKKQWFIRFNRLKLKIYGVQFGKHCLILNHFFLRKESGGVIEIGDNFTFTSGDGINPLCRNIQGMIYVGANSVLEIGDKVGISSACLWVKEKIHIGNNVKIGGDCILIDTDAHNLDWQVRAGLLEDSCGKVIDDCKSAVSAPISIEDDVWISTRCIILKGVTIGARSIIAAGSIVTKSIPPDCIAGGNPCKIIRRC